MNYRVAKVPASVGKAFIITHHYSKGIHNGPMTYGLYNDGEELVGVIAFATPNSENVRASIFGKGRKNEVTELHRMALVPGLPKNTASYFIVRALRLLKADKPHLNAVVSFADTTQGHLGTIYQATNAVYYGMTSPAWFFVDAEGRLRHPRQNGVNITASEGQRRGWTRVRRQAKHRYLYLLSKRPEVRSGLQITPQPYPKREN